MADDNTADAASTPAPKAKASDAKDATADRILAHLSELLRNGPVARDTQLWEHFHTVILPAFKADILKEL